MSIFTLFSILFFFFLFFLSQEKQKKRKPPTLRNAPKWFLYIRSIFYQTKSINIAPKRKRFWGLFQWFNSLRPHISQEHDESKYVMWGMITK